MTTAAEINQIITVANLKILSRTLQLTDFLELLPESQLATLLEAKELLKDPEVEEDARSQLLQLITAIAACSSLTGEVKDRAIALVAHAQTCRFNAKFQTAGPKFQTAGPKCRINMGDNLSD